MLLHTLSNWLMPVNFSILLGFVSILLWRYANTTAKVLSVVAFIHLWFFATPFVAQTLINHLQKNYHPLTDKQLIHSSATAMVVLGGGYNITPEYPTKYMVSAITLERLQYTAYLYQRLRLPIIVSGGKIQSGIAPTEADLMQQTLTSFFHTPVAWQEESSANTQDESRFVIPILQQHHIKTIYLITNAWHMTRSEYVFKTALAPLQINVIPAPMGFILNKPNSLLAKILPSISALQTSTLACHEYFGLLWYHFKLLIKQ